MIDPQDITGLVLAGGRGSRMGGVDKGLQNHMGAPLAMHALMRLGPQVGQLMVNANRNLGAYEAFGAPVWPDANPDYAGPLSGFLAGLEHCDTPYLVTVPCDSPLFPLDLVQRLAAALVEQESLIRFTQSGQRKIDKWTAQHRCVEVPFDDAQAFANANTLTELQQLQVP
jgi:molybdopterin-guanine dinucleotide biosynthesis protein A